MNHHNDLEALQQDFITAVSDGNLEAMRALIERATDNRQALLEARNYLVFHRVAKLGNFRALQYLLGLMSVEQQQAMICAQNYSVLHRAMRHAQSHMVRHLIALAQPQLESLLFSLFDRLVNEDVYTEFNDLVFQALSYPRIFAWAESQTNLYHACIQSYIDTTLTVLYESITAFATEHPQGVFDETNPEQATLYFYIVRHLIRTPGNMDTVAWLLTIPSVQALTINEGLDDVNLAALALNRESSMRILTQTEQQLLTNALRIYQPQIEARGAAVIVQELRDRLATAYAANPATHKNAQGELIHLPLNWDAAVWANTAYYQHPVHTAWRYLQKPNPWMHADALFVHVSEDNPQEKWSTFDQYLPEIALFYLGATDAAQPDLDGVTLTTRFQLFVNEIALIARAHNWDKKRLKAGSTTEWEEYDDLEADKPSCHLGVKNRLFQSVVGHPLFQVLTKEGVKQELVQFMRAHFMQRIQASADHGHAYQLAWNELCTNAVFNPVLNELDVPEAGQQGFIQYLREKYVEQFNIYPEFVRYITHRFRLSEVFQAHVVSFATETGFDDLFPEFDVIMPVMS
jgi:hypothetical protein